MVPVSAASWLVSSQHLANVLTLTSEHRATLPLRAHPCRPTPPTKAAGRTASKPKAAAKPARQPAGQAAGKQGRRQVEEVVDEGEYESSEGDSDTESYTSGDLTRDDSESEAEQQHANKQSVRGRSRKKGSSSGSGSSGKKGGKGFSLDVLAEAVIADSKVRPGRGAACVSGSWRWQAACGCRLVIGVPVLVSQGMKGCA